MKGGRFRGVKTNFVHPASGQQVAVRTATEADIRWSITAEKAARLERKFNRLLSAGYKIGGKGEEQVLPPDNAEDREEQKKNTDLVSLGESGNASHGGKHASCEVADSPNASEKGNRPRGSRGGRKPKTAEERRSEQCEAKLAKAMQDLVPRRGGAGVFSPTPVVVNPSIAASAKASAELLKELVGKATQKQRKGTEIRIKDLLVALETGDDPTPALLAPRMRRRAKVLVTPDTSGSTQGWSGLSQGWAVELAKSPELDVYHVLNFNGQITGDVTAPARQQKFQLRAEQLLPQFDIVIYLGDGDGRATCQRHADGGAVVIALDCYAARVAQPRLTEVPAKQGRLFWIDRCSIGAPSSWTEAIKLALEAL